MKEHLMAFLMALAMVIFFFGAIYLVEGNPF
jgi:hypothetical protein